MSEILYFGVFLNQAEKERLLKIFPPVHEKIFCNHITIRFLPTITDCLDLPIGEKINFDILGEVKDELGQALVVRFEKNFSIQQKNLHLTISAAPNIEPKYSLELFSNKNFMECKPVKSFGKVGVVTEAGKIFDAKDLKISNKI